MLTYLSTLEDVFGPLRLFNYITFRALMAGITALFIGYFIAPWIIQRLSNFKQSVRTKDEVGSDLAEKHANKVNTPTMGGIIILVSDPKVISIANDKFLTACDVVVVEPDPKRYNAFKVSQSNRLTTHPKNIADDDPRYFNLSSVEDGDSYTALKAPALKRIHREQFDRFIALRNLTQIIKTTFPSRLIDNPDQSLKPGEHSNQEIIAVAVDFEYG